MGAANSASSSNSWASYHDRRRLEEPAVRRRLGRLSALVLAVERGDLGHPPLKRRLLLVQVLDRLLVFLVAWVFMCEMVRVGWSRQAFQAA